MVSGPGTALLCVDTSSRICWPGPAWSFPEVSVARRTVRSMNVRVPLDVVYCEGWDGEARRIVGRLTTGTARGRDDRGEQYAVAFVAPGTESPQAVLEVAWAHRFARYWHFDQAARRDREIEFRLLGDGRLFCLHSTVWDYTDPDQAEFDEEQVRHVVTAARPDGTVRTSTRVPDEGTSETIEQKRVDELHLPAPRFGEWADLLGWPTETRHHDTPDEAAGPPWRPAVPLQPRNVELFFEPGLRWPSADGVVETEVRRAGTVRLVSGRVVAADPGWLQPDLLEPFTVTAAPGEYPVDLAVVRFVDEPDHERVAAARLVITPERVVSWEMALRPGQDPLLLSDERFYGFSVDAGLACFVDADALGAMEAMLEETFEELLAGLTGGTAAQVADPASGATLVGFPSGWGDGVYPTWVGRTAAGEVACFVADFLVLYEAERPPVSEPVA
ncbi:DUF4241 domain-containing protein [Saccharomonospora piscinae]|uniref:DUF4241 domain-containing protein n=1 Tax=Saccharomonospora piscinae TaxID=687388 RepID=UPI001ABE2B72|nr:DUF4241 domain-containing protein [Saccharomonospora piscinae]